jgi:hypothetical protein
MQAAVEEDGKQWQKEGEHGYCVAGQNGSPPETVFTTDREESLGNDRLGLLGLDHRVVERYMTQYRELSPTELGIRVQSPDGRTGAVSVWQVTSQGERGETRSHIVLLAIGSDGQRVPMWERSVDQLFRAAPSQRSTNPPVEILVSACDTMLHRELGHRQIISERRGYEAKMIGWVDVVGPTAAWDGAAIQAAIEKSSRSNSKSVEQVTLTTNPEALGLGDDVAKMRALSIRQPFAEAIMRGSKTTEFRSGPTNIRGRILIYASLGRYGDAEETEMLQEFGITDVEADDLPRGVIVGSVELYDSDEGEWLLRNPQRAKKLVEPLNRPNPVWFYPF